MVDPTGSHRLTLRSGGLTGTVVDNHDGLSGPEQIDRRARLPSAADGHGALCCTVPFEERFNGYNGLARLQYEDSCNPFVASAAGHNCEFFFDRSDASFEPRWEGNKEHCLAQSSSLTSLSDTSARLTIDPGQRWGVQVESLFRLAVPYYVDIEHSFTPTDGAKLSDQVLGVFWASYIQVPRQPTFYFLAPGERWTSIYEALDHYDPGIIAPECGPVGSRLARQAAGRRLLYGIADTRYSLPFFCGKVLGMLLSMMFRPADDVEIRFAFNSVGGGPGAPAWDFQAVVADPHPGKRYSFETRTVYKSFEGFDEALELYRDWERNEA